MQQNYDITQDSGGFSVLQIVCSFTDEVASDVNNTYSGLERTFAWFSCDFCSYLQPANAI